MKVAFAFLFVALSCYFGSGDTGYTAHKKVVPTIPKDCLEKLIKVDVPETLTRLQEMLCLYMKAKKTQNEELYKQFLKEVHRSLIDAGCSVEQILSTPEFLGAITRRNKIAAVLLVHTKPVLITQQDKLLHNTEKQVGDQVGRVAQHCGLQMLKAVEDLGLSDVVMNVLCNALGETLKSLSQSLAGLNLNVGGVVGGGVPGLPLLG